MFEKVKSLYDQIMMWICFAAIFIYGIFGIIGSFFYLFIFERDYILAFFCIGWSLLFSAISYIVYRYFKKQIERQKQIVN